jgi:fused signal recognition particle receptor
MAQTDRSGWWQRFSQRVEKGTRVFSEGLDDLLLGAPTLTPEFYQRLEELLLGADLGAATTRRVLQELEAGLAPARVRNRADAVALLQRQLLQAMEARPRALRLDAKPSVILVLGVNGSGKTTTIGKLAHRLSQDGHRPLLGAADTYRAAAIEQLQIWGDRANAPVIAHKPGSDPGAVAYDAVEAARARGCDVVLIDTAGRLHTNANLLEELRKVARVVGRAAPGAPQETLLVLDANFGQNALTQAQRFHEAVRLTGLVVAKMDGTARGATLIAIEEALKVPVKLVGIGEDLGDLNYFEPKEYLRALFKGSAE